jgi:hypothetical protein
LTLGHRHGLRSERLLFCTSAHRLLMDSEPVSADTDRSDGHSGRGQRDSVTPVL